MRKLIIVGAIGNPRARRLASSPHSSDSSDDLDSAGRRRLQAPSRSPAAGREPFRLVFGQRQAALPATAPSGAFRSSGGAPLELRCRLASAASSGRSRARFSPAIRQAKLQGCCCKRDRPDAAVRTTCFRTTESSVSCRARSRSRPTSAVRADRSSCALLGPAAAADGLDSADRSASRRTSPGNRLYHGDRVRRLSAGLPLRLRPELARRRAAATGSELATGDWRRRLNWSMARPAAGMTTGGFGLRRLPEVARLHLQRVETILSYSSVSSKKSET